MNDANPIDPVAAIMAAAVDVPVPDGFGGGFAPHPGGDDPQGRDPGDEYPYGPGGAGSDDNREGYGSNGGPPIDDDPALQERLAYAVEFALNDVGNGQRMVLHFGSDILWVPRVGWHGWTGTHWQVDPDQIAVRRLVQKLGPLIEAELPFVQVFAGMWARLAEADGLLAARATALTEVDDKGKLTSAAEARIKGIDAELGEIAELRKVLAAMRGTRASFAKSSGNTARMKSAVEEAGFNLTCQLDAMDAAPLQINCLSGVLEFSVGQDGHGKKAVVQLVPHDRGQRHTKIMPVDYDPDAQAPQFVAFLSRIQPDVQIRQFLQRVFGLAMTGLTGDQMLCFFYGMGANGKSVLVDLVAKVLGDYAATAKIESLTGSNRRGGGDATPDLMDLIGARFVRASEPDEGVKWQEGLIKDLTGGEPMKVRALNENFVDFRPQFKLVISGNHKPDIRGTDDGIWRRLKLVPFDVQIPKAERIPKDEMDAALFAEAPGVLNWMVEGLLDYLEQGLREPDAVRLATQEFREESDPFGLFLDQCCEVTGDPSHIMLARDLTYAFLFWQAANAKGAFSEGTVSKRMAGKAERWISAKTGQRFAKAKSSISRYSGIRLTPFFSKEWDLCPKDIKGKPLMGRSRGSDDDGDAPVF